MNRRGQALIESMFILAAFLGLLLGIIRVGQMLMERESVMERVRAAARWGALHPYDPSAIRKMVQERKVVVGNPDCPGARCRISVAVPELGVWLSEPARPAP